MKQQTRIVALLLLLNVAALASAQQPAAPPPKSDGGEPPPALKKLIRTLGKIGNAPVHPIISSVASGGSIGPGLGMNIPLPRSWEWEAKGVYTLHHYWLGETSVERIGRRSEIEGYARLRDMTQIAFYGRGNESIEDDRTAFAMREFTGGARTYYKLTPFLTLGARAEYVNPTVRDGKDPRFPSTPEVFHGEVLPGLTSAATYVRTLGYAEVPIAGSVGDGFYQGTILRGTFAHYQDLDEGTYTFNRVDGEIQQKFAGLGAAQRLTLHGWVSHAIVPAGNDVPIYLDRTLGHQGQLKSVHEYLLGTDNSQATLRGYTRFRFQDRDALLMQAEYRAPIWGPFEATAFYDAGKVAHDKSDLTLTNLHHDYGFSMSFMRAHSTVLRVDLGLGGEGPVWIVTMFTGEKQ